MIATWYPQQQTRCDGTGDGTGECACHLPLGPHVDSEGRASEVAYCDGHRWHTLPYCTTCGHRFAEPTKGRVCCVCLGKLYGKCIGCGSISYVPTVAGLCEECRDFAELLDSGSKAAYSRILARRLARAAQATAQVTAQFDALGAK